MHTVAEVQEIQFGIGIEHNLHILSAPVVSKYAILLLSLQSETHFCY